MVMGELLAVLSTLTLPANVPLVNGAKITEKLVLWPAARFSGRASPVALNDVPDRLNWEIVTVEFPVLDNVTVCPVLLVPTVVDAKLSDVGLAESWYVCVSPVPDSATFVGEIGALVERLSVPEAVPAAAGA